MDFPSARRARLRISRSVFLYKPTPRDGSLVITTLLELAERYPRYGFAKYFAVLRREGYTWNHKRVYRIYRQLQLNMRRKGKRHLPSRAPVRLEGQTVVNGCWPVDFMSDALMHGQRFRTFNVLDDFSGEVLAVEVDTNLPAARIIRVLDRIAARRGYPKKCVWTMARNLSRRNLPDGLNNTGLTLSSLNPASPRKTHMWSGSTAPSARRY